MPALNSATDGCHFFCIQGRRKTMCLDCTIANGHSGADIRIMRSPAITLLEQQAQSLEKHKLLLGQGEGTPFMHLCKQALLSMHVQYINIKCTVLLKFLEQRIWKSTGCCLIFLQVYLVSMCKLIGLELQGLEAYKQPWIAFHCTFPKSARGAECHSQSLLDC